MLRVRNLQVDVPADDHGAAVAYWTAALGGHDGGTGDDTSTHLTGLRSPLPVHLQRTAGTDGVDPGRYHLDLVADDVDSEVERLVRLGATVETRGEWTVLRDPAGLLLCVDGTDEAAPDQHPNRDVTPAPRLHLVVLDVPSGAVQPVVRFWSEALGLGVHRGDSAAYTFLGERAAPPRDGWGLLVQDVGATSARMHVDLHVPTPADRHREVARLEVLGASRVGAHDHWVVLAAPGGHLHCIVPDTRD